MSAQGIFILDGMDSRPKSKKQLKELVAAGQLDMIALEQEACSVNSSMEC